MTRFFQFIGIAAHSHHGQGLLTHGRSQLVDDPGLQVRKLLAAAAYDLERDRREQETDGGPDAGLGGNDDPPNAQLVAEPGGVKRKGSLWPLTTNRPSPRATSTVMPA
jgi:hypothetical protein